MAINLLFVSIVALMVASYAISYAIHLSMMNFKWLHFGKYPTNALYSNFVVCIMCIMMFLYFVLVVQILKKYYHTLCHSLSPNVVRNLSVVARMGGVDSMLRSQIEKCQVPVKANQMLLDRLILCLDYEERAIDLCDLLDGMIQDGDLKRNLEMFRNGMQVCNYIWHYNVCYLYRDSCGFE